MVRIRIGSEPVRVNLGESTALALAAKDAAAISAAMALAASGPNYASTAAGLAATTLGDSFVVDNADGTGSVYLHESGPSATFQRKFIIDPQAATAADLLGYGPSGADQATTVADALNGWSSDIGFSTLEAAITEGAGKTIYLTRNWTITSEIDVPADTRVVGRPDVTVSLGANCKGFVTSASNVELVGLRIDGNRATYTDDDNWGIYVDWTSVAGSNVTIEDCRVDGVAGSGIIALASSGTASSGLFIRGCRVTSVGAHGIISQDYISDVEITGNYVNATGLDVADRPGISAGRSGSNIVVSHNIAIGSASAMGTSSHGISIDEAAVVVCNNNLVRGWKSMGIEVGFVTAGTFNGNTIYGCKYGIAASGVESTSKRNSNITVSGNTIHHCETVGIWIFMTGATGAYLHQRISISGNTITDIYGTNGAGILANYVDGLSIVGNPSVTSCVLVGINLVDCPNHFIDGNDVRRNNLAGLKTISSLTNSGSTATATVTSHGYTTGDAVAIFGASPTEYRATRANITVTGANTFTYPLPRSGLASPAVGGPLQCSKIVSTSGGGVRIQWSLIGATARGRNRIGVNCVAENGYADLYDVSFNGATGMPADILFLPDVAANPRAENLTSGASSNVLDRVGVYMKNGKIVFAYNNAGTVYYLIGTLDGSTATWANSSTAP